MPEPDSNTKLYQMALAALGGFAASVVVWWMVGGNSVVMQQAHMQDQITGCQQALADERHEIDQLNKSITDLQATNAEVEERLRWIMALPSSSDYHPPPPHKK